MAGFREREVEKGAQFDLSVNRLPSNVDRRRLQNRLMAIVWLLQHSADDYVVGREGDPGAQVGIYRQGATFGEPAIVIYFDIDSDVCRLQRIEIGIDE